jgi:hypothetical protein
MDAVREQMMKDLQLKGITPRTQKKYLREVSIMAKYFDKPLEELGEKDVKDYLVHMLETRKLSRGTYRGDRVSPRQQDEPGAGLQSPR